MNWFKECLTVGSIKKLYRHLAKEFHPDISEVENAGRIMQQINDAYHALLKRLDGQTSIGSDGKEHTYRYNQNIEQAVMDKVAEVLKVAKPGWLVEIIGTWLWVSNTDRADKDLLNKNGAGLKWHSKRGRWYWHAPTYRRRYRANLRMDDLRAMYGTQTMEQEAQVTIGA